MSHVVRKEGWAVVDLGTVGRKIFVRQDWHYSWTVDKGQQPWREDEKTAFHRAVDRAVWGSWSHRVRIQARDMRSTPASLRTGVTALVAGSVFSLSFDVRSVPAAGHWEVTVRKNDPSVKPKPRAEVDFPKKTIRLFTTDLLVTKAKRPDTDDPWHYGFSLIGHEFGHTVGNFGPKGDEYFPTSKHFDDVESIMNIGHQLRARHVTLLCQTLHAMVPGCEFIPLTR
jgi:hypothetical protein